MCAFFKSCGVKSTRRYRALTSRANVAAPARGVGAPICPRGRGQFSLALAASSPRAITRWTADHRLLRPMRPAETPQLPAHAARGRRAGHPPGGWPAAPDVTYPAPEPRRRRRAGPSYPDHHVRIIMVIAVVDAITALIAGLISDIVQLATASASSSSASASSASTRRCGCRARSRCSRTRSTPAARRRDRRARRRLGGRAGGPAAAASSLLQVGEGRAARRRTVS